MTRDTKPAFYKTKNGYMKPITNIEILKEAAREDLQEFVNQGGEVEGGEQYIVAVRFLEQFFGYKWIEKHILNTPPIGFFGRGMSEGGNNSIAMRKVINLAEFVLNLSPKNDIDTCLHMIASGEIEPSYAELEVAKLLMTRNVHFNFVKPTTKGESYDLLIDAPLAGQVCAETKCKLETGRFSPKGVLESLKAATKRNLPKDKPGTIFIKIPQEWYESPEIKEEIATVCEQFINEHLRLVSINIFSSHISSNGKILTFRFDGIEISSHIHRFGTHLNWKFFDGKDPKNSTPDSWITLENILKSKLIDRYHFV